MDVGSVINQLIGKDISFPALKLVLDNQVDLKCSAELPKITPSHYLRENGLTTDQRLALLCKQQRKMSCWRPGNDVVVEPAIVVFQNYKSGETHQVPINIRNTSKMSQKVVILMDENSIFKLDQCSQRVAKFPCGMAITATINFYPEDDRDYYHKLVIHTNASRFAIPIVCIGGRGLLNAPDSIVYEAAPVKYMNTKIIPLYNNGRKPARFTLSTTGPFCVSPEKGLVPPRDSFSMNVSFYSEVLGEHDGSLVIKYENGEEVYVCLRATAISLNISLQPSEVDFDDIYIGLPSRLVCSLTNDSDYVLDYKWKKEPRAIEAASKKSTPDALLTAGRSSSVRRSGGDNLDRVIDLLENCEDGNEDCLGVAMGLEEFINLKNLEQLFSDECFIIEPTSGQLQPHSSTDVFVIFTPQHPNIRCATPYLDVCGLSERIPLSLSGRGLGPKFKFGFEVLDLGVVIFGGAHAYEIPVVNVGAISGKVVFDKVMGLSSNPSLDLKVAPRKLDLEPEEHGAFYVSFHSAAKLGPFEDEIKFILPRTKDQVYVTVRGEITDPLMNFRENEDVACGDEQDPLVDCKMIPKSSSEEAFSEDPPQSSIKPAKRTRKTTKKKPKPAKIPKARKDKESKKTTPESDEPKLKSKPAKRRKAPKEKIADFVPFHQEVHLPTLKLEKTHINFGTIVNGTEAVEDLTVVNEGPDPVVFKWYILPGTTTVVRGRRQAQLDQDFLEVSPSTTHSSEVVFKDLPVLQSTAISGTTDSGVMLPYSRDLYGRTTSSESLDNYVESVQVERVRLQREKLLNILGLQDPEDEYEDEYNYLTHHIPEPVEREIFVNELVDIIPLAGVVPAGSAQTFSVVFYGHNDINFQTTAICLVEGGIGVSVTIRGISSPRPASLIPPVVKTSPLTPSKLSLETPQEKKNSKDIKATKKNSKKTSHIKKQKKHVRLPKQIKKDKKKAQKLPPCNPNEPGDAMISPMTLQLFGSCVPAICNDPEVLFPKMVDYKREGHIHNRVYIRDEDCFDFGPIIVPLKRVVPQNGGVEGEAFQELITPTPRIKHKDNVAKFIVKNISSLPAVCTLCLVHGRRKYFEFSPERFIVEPGGEQKVSLWAFPRLPEVVIEDHLVVCIKDNPDPIFFRVRVVGTTPQVSLEQNIVDFGKTLLNSRATAQVTVANTGVIPILWQLSKQTRLPEHVFIEKPRGIIKPQESAHIRFLFKSEVPDVINDALLDIEFLDTQKMLGVIDVFKIALQGEAYDVVVDILSEKKEFTLIDFGVLPVGFPIVQNIIVSNCGNYDIFFRFVIDPEKLSSKNKQFKKILNDYMLVFPSEDALESNQSAVVQLVFEPPKSMHFKNEPILSIELVDLVMNVLIAEITIPISVKSERQTISPDNHNH